MFRVSFNLFTGLFNYELKESDKKKLFVNDYIDLVISYEIVSCQYPFKKYLEIKVELIQKRDNENLFHDFR